MKILAAMLISGMLTHSALAQGGRTGGKGGDVLFSEKVRQLISQVEKGLFNGDIFPIVLKGMKGQITLNPSKLERIYAEENTKLIWTQKDLRVRIPGQKKASHPVQAKNYAWIDLANVDANRANPNVLTLGDLEPEVRDHLESKTLKNVIILHQPFFEQRLKNGRKADLLEVTRLLIHEGTGLLDLEDSLDFSVTNQLVAMLEAQEAPESVRKIKERFEDDQQMEAPTAAQISDRKWECTRFDVATRKYLDRRKDPVAYQSTRAERLPGQPPFHYRFKLQAGVWVNIAWANIHKTVRYLGEPSLENRYELTNRALQNVGDGGQRDELKISRDGTLLIAELTEDPNDFQKAGYLTGFNVEHYPTSKSNPLRKVVAYFQCSASD